MVKEGFGFCPEHNGCLEGFSVMESEKFCILLRLLEKGLLEARDQGGHGSNTGRGMVTWIMVGICLNASWSHPLLIWDSYDY